MAGMRVINRGTCRHCERPVIWGRLQNGRRRAFQSELVVASEVPERERFAVRKGGQAVIDLEGIKHDPQMLVLTPHYCREYFEHRQMRNVDRLSAMLPGDRSERPDWL